MSIQKFHGQPDEESEQLQWVIGEDLPPLRGHGNFALTEDMLDRLYTARDFRARLFRLWIPQEAAAYILIKDKITNGLYEERYIDRQFCPAAGHYWIFLEWCRKYSAIGHRTAVFDPTPSPVVYGLQNG